ncbi:molybdopterin converting factor subunit 1 [Balneatrix alpica]|uniref:Molybdopterin synthase sulfur carrier subunit n=1 Tax=Balneatrix alpica TaxID=75684 RepID=A0ABV5ZD89_9GAMM|nr:molybdopterin converting factor subunit 1 [Balneatrix alpica]
MIKVLFFASFRDQLGCAELRLEWPQAAPLSSLLAQLQGRGERWQEVLGQPNLLMALNQELVDGQAEVVDGDEVAFFPPVTGG